MQPSSALAYCDVLPMRLSRRDSSLLAVSDSVEVPRERTLAESDWRKSMPAGRNASMKPEVDEVRSLDGSDGRLACMAGCKGRS